MNFLEEPQYHSLVMCCKSSICKLNCFFLFFSCSLNTAIKRKSTTMDTPRLPTLYKLINPFIIATGIPPSSKSVVSVLTSNHRVPLRDTLRRAAFPDSLPSPFLAKIFMRFPAFPEGAAWQTRRSLLPALENWEVNYMEISQFITCKYVEGNFQFKLSNARATPALSPHNRPPTRSIS